MNSDNKHFPMNPYSAFVLCSLSALCNAGCAEDGSMPVGLVDCSLPKIASQSPVSIQMSVHPLPEEAELVSQALFQDDSIAFTAWPDPLSGFYQIRTHAGPAVFERVGTEHGWEYRWESLEAPFTGGGTDGSTYTEELAMGSNPNSVRYSESGYEEDDVRLSFIAAEDGNYPRLAERIAQVFDGPNSPELIWSLQASAGSGLGSHGGMSLGQSRAPLLMHGPGIKEGAEADVEARVVDIAPTVAALLGVEPVDGQTFGYNASNLMLAWQDGRVLHELFESECSYGSAERAVVIILDGLAHTELEWSLSENLVPNMQRLAQGGLRLTYGSLVGFPSFSLPGHLSVHTGLYPGHHGLLSNQFLDRSTGELAINGSLQDLLIDPYEAQRVSNTYLSNEAETIFEAVNRSFPNSVTASVNELTIRGATYCRLCESSRGLDDYLEYELADELALMDFETLWSSHGAPKYLAMSFYLSDSVGEGHGPHSDALREALVKTDERIGRVLDRYDEAGLFDSTLFVITADHGMEIQDTSRAGNPASFVQDVIEGASTPSRGLVYWP